MRFVTVAVTLCLCVSSGLSQITITAADAQAIFSVGKSLRVISVSTPPVSTTMNVGTASSSAQTWTYPGVGVPDTSREDNVLPSSTPYTAQFPTATHAQKYTFTSSGVTSTVYLYYKMTADSVLQLGNVMRTKIENRDTTILTIGYKASFVYPWTVGKSLTRRDSSAVGGGIYFIQRSVQTADAFGTLVLPVGTFQALRIRGVTYSETYFGPNIVSRDSIFTFDFYTKEGNTMNVTPANKVQTNGTIPVSSYAYSSVITTPASSVELVSSVPTQIQLYQNYPNPFNPTTNIEFRIGKYGIVTLKIFDVLGREVATLVNEPRPEGVYTVRWDASLLPSGVYFYRLISGAQAEIGRMNLTK
jgi:hypothetical protein